MAEPAGGNVVRGGKEGGLNRYHYDAQSDAPFEGWKTVEEHAGEVGLSGGESGDHFSAAMGRGNYGHPQPKTQV